MYIIVQENDFDIDSEITRLYQGNPAIGAVASFVGLVRAEADNPVNALTLEHYPGMTQKSLESIANEALDRFNIMDVTIIHRTGFLIPGDRIVLVITAGGHREQSFLACEFIMDYLKTSAPFWKKETSPTGSHWVEAQKKDDVAFSRWGDDNMKNLKRDFKA
ncbi:MAG: molybdenum cofactor biosynthesis protein MoaE [Pseudomonadota bacterium]|nr:molybdenum cofactor biosynthesis protein MoaE [Pseudomonadota bacterium]